MTRGEVDSVVSMVNYVNCLMKMLGIEIYRAEWFLEDASSYDVDRIAVDFVRARCQLASVGHLLIDPVLRVTWMKNQETAYEIPSRLLLLLSLPLLLLLLLPEAAC
jgi:hypothetical protein